MIRDERDITREILEARKPENGGERVIALRPVMLSGNLPKSEKIMPPGTVFMLSKEEYARLSRAQRTPYFETDTARCERDLRENNPDLRQNEIDMIVDTQEDMINFILAQPGGKDKLKALQVKSGPVVKKTSKKLSSMKDIEELRGKYQKEIDAADARAEEQVRASNPKPKRSREKLAYRR
jgi:ElaB/YqjD/DUF883 family membrane-anchored ribosome-binding protein